MFCSDTEFLDLNPEVSKYCFCFIRDSEYLEIRHLENLREAVKSNDLLTQFIDELNQIQMINFNVGYLELEENLQLMNYIFLDVVNAYSAYSESLEESYISPFKLSQRYTNFFID